MHKEMLGKDYILINNSLNKMESEDGPSYKVILIVFFPTTPLFHSRRWWRFYLNLPLRQAPLLMFNNNADVVMLCCGVVNWWRPDVVL